MLRIKAGREGESQGAHGDIEFTNVGSRPCVLRGLPEVAIVEPNGKSVPVLLVRDPGVSLSPVVLPAGGVVTGAFNGPPDYNLVPGCPVPGHPSTISVTDAYLPSR